MKNLSLLMATAALVLAGCGDKDKAVAPETIDQAAQGMADEVAVEVVESATDTDAVATEEVTQEVVTEPAPEAAAAEPDLAQGKAIYSKSCLACHGTGAAGAPKLGDADNWAPRIAQGLDTLAGHAIGGFKGSTGYMPPKGGFMALSDAEVTAAVAYMVSESR